MNCIKIAVKYLDHYQGLDKPAYQTAGAAGMDLLAAVESDQLIKAGERRLIPTGISIALPDGFEAQIRPRSGLALKYGVTLLNSPGTIDSDYRGEIKVILMNLGDEDFFVSRGMRIAQMVVSPYYRAELDEEETIDETTRNTGGFGHTGV